MMATVETKQAVRERPMLFSGPMVRAIRTRFKTQTRRVVEPCQVFENLDCLIYDGPHVAVHDGPNIVLFKRKYRPGDRIWVQEAVWCYDKLRRGRNGQMQWPHFDDAAAGRRWFDGACAYVDDLGSHEPVDGGRLNKMFMPRWAARLILQVVSERFERLQQISLADCAAEGAPPTHATDQIWDSTNTFRAIWDQINGPRGHGWVVNDWVRVVRFKVIDGMK